MTIVTLISDWGINSHYQSSVKGRIYSQIKNVQIVDITHTLQPFDIMNCSFILRNSYPDFPPGTIHIIGVNTEAGTETPHVVARFKDMYFIGSDNGVFSLLFENETPEIYELNVMQESDYFTFSSRDVFVKTAALISSGTPLEEIGNPISTLKKMYAFKPVISSNRIEGKVIFIDDYENVFVNIDHASFRTIGKGRPYSIKFRAPDYAIEELHTSYSDVDEGERLALFGSSGYLEIAINRGKAASLLGLQITDPVIVEFEELL